MFIPKFYHLSGTDLWQHCDFENLQINAKNQSVELADTEQIDHIETNPQSFLNNEFNDLLGKKGAAIQLLYRPDQIDDSLILLADPEGDLVQLTEEGWTSLLPKKQKKQRGKTCFTGTAFSNQTETLFENPKTLSVDPVGRLWVLELGSNKIRALDSQSLRVLTTIVPPDLTPTIPALSVASVLTQETTKITDLAATEWGLVICDKKNHRVWQKAYEYGWLDISERVFKGTGTDQQHYECIALSGHPKGDAVAILRHISNDQTINKHDQARSRLVYISQTDVKIINIDDFEDPLHLLLSDKNSLFVAEAGKDKNNKNIHHFTSYHLDSETSDKKEIKFHKKYNWILRYFDGKAIYTTKNGEVWGTTMQGGVYPLSRANTNRITEGRVETYAFDSEKIACQWHRIFIDTCLPIETQIEVRARVSDVLADSRVRREPRAAHGINTPATHDDQSINDAWQNLPLGSIDESDNREWVSLGVLDKRPYQADIPLSPHDRKLPSRDKHKYQRTQHSEDADEVSFITKLQTLEGLVKNTKGRYLWLRITLKGDGKYSPSIRAIRASFNRPSLLNHLPAYWQADPKATQETDQALSLFEGQYTELSQSVLQFKQLLDPCICPAEALPWLASFIDFSFDTRITEPVRRQLLKEMTSLYRQKGTVKGLERLCEILTGRKIAIVEGFRLRRRSLSVLGQKPKGSDISTGAILGGGLQIGGPEPDSMFMPYKPQEQWEAELLQEHEKTLERLDGGDCPREAIPEPFPKDAALAFYRRFSHRFHVIIFGPKSDEIESVIKEAIEANKPAHTIHNICWLESGIRVGKNTYLGLGTVIAKGHRLRPAILGHQVLGGGTLSQQQNTFNSDRDNNTPKTNLFSVGTSLLGVAP